MHSFGNERKHFHISDLAALIRSLYCFFAASLKAPPFKNLRGLERRYEMKNHC